MINDVKAAQGIILYASCFDFFPFTEVGTKNADIIAIIIINDRSHSNGNKKSFLSSYFNIIYAQVEFGRIISIISVTPIHEKSFGGNPLHFLIYLYKSFCL